MPGITAPIFHIHAKRKPRSRDGRLIHVHARPSHTNKFIGEWHERLSDCSKILSVVVNFLDENPAFGVSIWII
jgi:hypothetical protein